MWEFETGTPYTNGGKIRKMQMSGKIEYLGVLENERRIEKEKEIDVKIKTKILK